MNPSPKKSEPESLLAGYWHWEWLIFYFSFITSCFFFIQLISATNNVMYWEGDDVNAGSSITNYWLPRGGIRSNIYNWHVRQLGEIDSLFEKTELHVHNITTPLKASSILFDSSRGKMFLHKTSTDSILQLTIKLHLSHIPKDLYGSHIGFTLWAI